MTAHAMKGDEEKCLQVGMDGYISKPINQERLFHTLWQSIESHQPPDSPLRLS
jgi:two-component system sensor histidine kinase/response regulator